MGRLAGVVAVPGRDGVVCTAAGGDEVWEGVITRGVTGLVVTGLPVGEVGGDEVAPGVFFGGGLVVTVLPAPGDTVCFPGEPLDGCVAAWGVEGLDGGRCTWPGFKVVCGEAVGRGEGVWVGAVARGGVGAGLVGFKVLLWAGPGVPVVSTTLGEGVGGDTGGFTF